MLTLDELCAVRALGKLLLEGVAAGSVRVGDGGLIDLCLLDRGVVVLVSHVIVVGWVEVDVCPTAVLLSSSREQRETEQRGMEAAGSGPPLVL